MDKYVFLESEYRGMDMRSGWIQHNYYDACSGQAYYDFIDYAFSICDYFMLVYVNYCGKGFPKTMKTSVYKGYKQDKIEMRGDRAEMSDFPLYLNTVAGGLDRRDQTIGGFSFVVKIYAVPVVEIIG